MSCVAELMSPVEHALVSTQPLGDAAKLLRGADAAVLVIDPSGHTLGVLTDEDLASVTAQDPKGILQSRCADACSGATEFLRAEQPIEGVLWRYRTENVQPLPVLNGWKPVGILYPAPVFLWCLEQPHLDITRAVTAAPRIVPSERFYQAPVPSPAGSRTPHDMNSDVSFAAPVGPAPIGWTLHPNDRIDGESTFGGKDAYTNR